MSWVFLLNTISEQN